MPIGSVEITQHFSQDQAFCALFYGLPGSGKTLLAGSAQYHPALADVAFVDADLDGLLSIAGIEGIHKISYDNLKDLITLPSYLHKNLPSVKTVVFDTMTSVKARRLAEIAEKRGDIDKSQLQDYNVMGNNIEKIVSDLRGAGYSVIFTTGSKDEYSKAGTFVKRCPDLPPALRLRMEHIASFIWHLYKGQDNTYNLVYLDSEGGLPLDIKTRNLNFVEKLHKLDREGMPGTIQIGATGDPMSGFPNLATFYSLLTSTLDTKAVA